MHQTDLDKDKSSSRNSSLLQASPSRVHFKPPKRSPSVPISSQEPVNHEEPGLPRLRLNCPADLDVKEQDRRLLQQRSRRCRAADRAIFAGTASTLITQAGVAAIVSIDNPAAIEPTHWPAAYARSVSMQPHTSTQRQRSLRSASAASRLQALRSRSGHSPSPTSSPRRARAFPSRASSHRTARIKLEAQNTDKDISSPNVLAILPGSDPKLAPEYVALSAHLDGYGYGIPVLGDNLYNGTLDDAAYVALLIELAKDLQHKAPARSLLFCIFTGEEKGLLGSAYFTRT